MSDHNRASFGNSAPNDQPRDYSKIPAYKRREVNMPRRVISDFLPSGSTIKNFAKPSNPVTAQTQSVPKTEAYKVTDSDLIIKAKKNKSRKSLALLSMAAVVFIAGLTVALLQLKTNNQVAAQVSKITKSASQTSNNNAAPPDETKPSNLDNYFVPPDQPRLLKISKINIDARVRKLGVTTQNQLQAPSNIYDAGWYEDSSKPGDAGGAILIDGHVHGPTLPGVFANLKKLKSGDIIQVERGDGLKVNFKVIKAQTYDTNKVDMTAALTSIVPGKLGLNLMTCAGSVDYSTDQYNQRLIVFTVKI